MKSHKKDYNTLINTLTIYVVSYIKDCNMTIDYLYTQYKLTTVVRRELKS